MRLRQEQKKEANEDPIVKPHIKELEEIQKEIDFLYLHPPAPMSRIEKLEKEKQAKLDYEEKHINDRGDASDG